MVDQCDEEGKHVGWSDWTSEDGPEAELESRYCYCKSVYLLSLNGVTHRLDAACFGFAELYSNLKKKKEFLHGVTVVIITIVIWHQCVNNEILDLLFSQ